MTTEYSVELHDRTWRVELDTSEKRTYVVYEADLSCPWSSSLVTPVEFSAGDRLVHKYWRKRVMDVFPVEGSPINGLYLLVVTKDES